MWYIMKKMLIGIVVGVISGLFASGGGLLLVPVYTHILKLDENNQKMKKRRELQHFFVYCLW